MNNQAVKIQKVLASLGLASRREVERWIKAGRIQVNGSQAELGLRIEAQDKVTVDGEKIQTRSFFSEQSECEVYLYNKPLGEECSKKPADGRDSVFDRFESVAHERLVLVGRLDVNTSGLLLFTNHGELANRLMHPSYGIEREYHVRIDGQLSQDQLDAALKGVEVDGFTAKLNKIESVGQKKARNHWYKVALSTGRNKEVRRLLNALGVHVSRLIRTRFAEISLPRSIPPGSYQKLKENQIKQLFKLVQLENS